MAPSGWAGWAAGPPRVRSRRAAVGSESATRINQRPEPARLRSICCLHCGTAEQGRGGWGAGASARPAPDQRRWTCVVHWSRFASATVGLGATPVWATVLYVLTGSYCLPGRDARGLLGQTSESVGPGHVLKLELRCCRWLFRIHATDRLEAVAVSSQRQKIACRFETPSGLGRNTCSALSSATKSNYHDIIISVLVVCTTCCWHDMLFKEAVNTGMSGHNWALSASSPAKNFLLGIGADFVANFQSKRGRNCLSYLQTGYGKAAAKIVKIHHPCQHRAQFSFELPESHSNTTGSWGLAGYHLACLVALIVVSRVDTAEAVRPRLWAFFKAFRICCFCLYCFPFRLRPLRCQYKRTISLQNRDNVHN